MARAPGVAVVGGGYAGMAAAVDLARAGVAVRVFDSAPVLGGRARQVTYRDESLDNGQHILSGAYTELIGMMEAVGVPPSAYAREPLSLHFPPAFSLVAPTLPAPLHMAWALLAAQGLTWGERLAAARFMQALKRDGYRVPAGETVAQLLERHRQRARVRAFLWEPLTIAALNTPVATASAQVLAAVLRDALGAGREASDLLLPRADLTALFPGAAARWLADRGHEVQVGTRVRAVRRELDGFLVDGEAAAAVVIAAGPHQLPAIDLPPDAGIAVGLDYEPIVTAYLRFDAPLRLPHAMFGQADRLVQWFFDRRRLAGAPPDAPGLVAAVISASGRHQDMQRDALAGEILSELARHVSPLPVLAWHKVVTEKFATFACTPGAQATRPANGTGLPGLVLAGDYTAGDYPGTLEGAVRSGRAAARLVIDHLRNRP